MHMCKFNHLTFHCKISTSLLKVLMCISKEPWKKTSLGWLPNPKPADALFVLEEYYKRMWEFVPATSSFRPQFEAENQRL